MKSNRSIDFESQNSNCISMHSLESENDALCAQSKSSLVQILLNDQLNRFQIDSTIESKKIHHCPSSINQIHPQSTCDTTFDCQKPLKTKQDDQLSAVESTVWKNWLPVTFASCRDKIGRFSISNCPPTLALLLFCFASSTCLLLRNRWIHNLIDSSVDQTHRLEQLSDFDQALTVQTDCGSYVGSVEQGSFAFKGIEYGQAERWQKAIAIWNHSKFCQTEKLHRAAQFGEVCAQIHPLKGKTFGSERCLYLNVWTPRLDLTAQLPVLVWLHSGFGQFGSGHEHHQRPTGLLARKLNAVLVTINYRLDALAFANNHNLALSDQLIALDWVQRYIAKFGGSPDRVTLAGADGGAGCALALLTSGQLEKRVSRLWLTGPAVYHHDRQSTSAVNRNSLGDQLEVANLIAASAKLNTAQLLRSFLGNSGEASFRVNDQNDLPIQGIFTQQWIRTDDELVHEAYPFNQTTRRLDSMPLLLGSAQHAIEYWPGPRDLFNWTWPAYTKYVVTSLDSFSTHTSAAALNLYPPKLNTVDKHKANEESKSLHSLLSLESTTFHDSNLIKQPLDNAIERQEQRANRFNDGDKESEQNHRKQAEESKEMNDREADGADALYARLVSDIRQTCPINLVSSNLVSHHLVPLYRYIVTARPSKPIQLYDYRSRLSFHLFEVIAFFDRLSQFIDQPNESDRLFAQQIQQTIADFLHAPIDTLLSQSQSNAIDSNRFDNENEVETSIAIDSMSRKQVTHVNRPKLGAGSSWPPFPAKIALIGNKNISLVDSYAASRCAFWTQHSLDRYAWTC